jgi:hypothetical protein
MVALNRKGEEFVCENTPLLWINLRLRHNARQYHSRS